MAKTKIIEREVCDGVYGMRYERAIVDHPTHGRILITEGFCGQDQLRGGAYRWDGGFVARVKETDTLDTISLPDERYAGCVTVLEVVQHGDDEERPLLAVSPGHVARDARL